MFITDVCVYKKTLIINEENDYSLFCFLNYFLFFAFINRTFKAELTHDIKNIF